MTVPVEAILDLRQRDGQAADSRPDYVDMSADVKVGFRQGRPVVAPPDGRDDSLQVGEIGEYQHYYRNDSVYEPSAGSFLRRLVESDHIETLIDAADELNTDRSTLKEAFDLHNVEIPDGDGGGPSDDQIKCLTMPSGQQIPLAVLADPAYEDKLILVELLGVDGLSIDEAATYLSDQLDVAVRASDIRQAAESAGLLSSDDTGDSDDLSFHLGETRADLSPGMKADSDTAIRGTGETR